MGKGGGACRRSPLPAWPRVGGHLWSGAICRRRSVMTQEAGASDSGSFRAEAGKPRGWGCGSELEQRAVGSDLPDVSRDKKGCLTCRRCMPPVRAARGMAGHATCSPCNRHTWAAAPFQQPSLSRNVSHRHIILVDAVTISFTGIRQPAVSTALIGCPSC